MSSSEEAESGFFDKFVAKIKNLSRDENQTSVQFEEIIPPSGLLSSTSKFSLTSSADTTRLVLNDINAGTHTAPSFELPKILDDTFSDVAEAIKLIDVAIANEKYNLQRVRQHTKDLAKPLSDSIGKEVAAVERFLQLNLRVKIEKNKEEAVSSSDTSDSKNKNKNMRIHIEIYKKWTDHEETSAKKFEEIEEERKKWDEIIEKYEKE